MRKAMWVVTGFWIAASFFLLATLSSISGDAGRFILAMATISVGLCAVTEAVHAIGQKIDRANGVEDEKVNWKSGALGSGNFEPISAKDRIPSAIYDE